MATPFLPTPRLRLPRAAVWTGPGRGARGRKRRRWRRLSELGWPGASAVEGHRWLPLEANPEGSARPGGGAEAARAGAEGAGQPARTGRRV